MVPENARGIHAKPLGASLFPVRFAKISRPNFFGALIPLRAFAIEDSSFFDVILWNSSAHRIDIWEHALCLTPLLGLAGTGFAT
jgi:hypothetical protein